MRKSGNTRDGELLKTAFNPSQSINQFVMQTNPDNPFPHTANLQQTLEMKVELLNRVENIV